MTRLSDAIIRAGRLDRAERMLEQSHAEASKAYREVIDTEPEAAGAIAHAIMYIERAQKIVVGDA